MARACGSVQEPVLECLLCQRSILSTIGPPDRYSMTYVELLQEWNEDEIKNNGLVHLHLDFGPIPSGTTVEDLAEQTCEILTGPSVDVTDQLL